MKFERRYSTADRPVAEQVEWKIVECKVTAKDGRVIFHMPAVEVPAWWSQNAADILAQKYFRKAGVPQGSLDGVKEDMPAWLWPRQADYGIVTGPETSARQVFHRLVGCWTYHGWREGMFRQRDEHGNPLLWEKSGAEEQASIFYDEMFMMLARQIGAPNSPQWFNTGLHWAYGIEGPASGQWAVDDSVSPFAGAQLSGAVGVDLTPPNELRVYQTPNSYERPQPHACQPAWATVSTLQGPVKIGDIFAENLIGLAVFDGGTDHATVEQVVSNGEQRVIRLELSNGNYIEVTENHKIWAKRDQQFEWVEAGTVEVRDRLIQATNTFVAGIATPQEITEAYLVGFLQGDGYQSRTQYTSPCIQFTTVNEEEHGALLVCLDKVFPGKHYHVRSRESISDKLDVKSVRLYGSYLLPFLDKYEITDDQWKSGLRVPTCIMRGGAPVSQAYLRGFFQAEGCVRIKGGSSNVTVVSVSQYLLEDIQHLLQNMGIYSRFGLGYEKRPNRQPIYVLSIRHKSERVKFREMISFVGGDKRGKLEHSLTMPGKSLPDLREEEVVGIVDLGVHQVFDIQTNSGKYLTNNVLVHNCFIQPVKDDLVNPGGIMDLWVREARLFKHGSGTGTNFSSLRGKDEKLSGGGVASGLMSWLRIGDSAAGAIQSGGTTRRAAKMVIVDADHPEIEEFVDWKVREEAKAASMYVGSQLIKSHVQLGDDLEDSTLSDLVPQAVKDRAFNGFEPEVFGIDWEGEAIRSVDGQNSNNSIRVTNEFMRLTTTDEMWSLKERVSGETCRQLPAADLWLKICRAAWASADPGVLFADTINEWHTCAADGPILACNPCGEYQFLDDTACNLASLRLVQFLREDGTFDVESFVHATRLWTVALEVSVFMASFPSREIALGTYNYRTLGLGYADLGALLMRCALPYDSDEGRALAAGVTALMTGVAYRTSAEMADELGPFPRWEANAEGMRCVLRNHARACHALHDTPQTTKFEKLSTLPVVLDRAHVPADLWGAIQQAWIAVTSAKHFRNAQTTVIAPTGTISFAMDCDTTGCEPDYALVKDKKLAGGGDMQRMVNQSVEPALIKLGYPADDSGVGFTNRRSILTFLEGTGRLPVEADGNKFSCVRTQDLPIFACANEIDPMGHVKMVAAIQPFLSGAASKTVNMASDATVETFDLIYREAHRLGVKAIAPYRDGCKLNQPLSAAKVETTTGVPACRHIKWDGLSKHCPECDEVMLANYADGGRPYRAVEEPLFKSMEDRMLFKPSRPLTSQEEADVKRFAEAITGRKYLDPRPAHLERGEREFLPWRRKGDTQKMKLGDDGLTVYLRTGEYPDGRLGEIFIDLAQQGSTLRGAFNCFSIAFSLALQYGAPLDVLVKNLAKVKFEPAGIVEGHEYIKLSTSIADLVARDLAMHYLDDHTGADVKRQPEPPLRAVGASVVATAPATRITGQTCPNCGELLRQAGTCRVCPNGDYDEGCG